MISLISGCKEDIEPIPEGLETFDFFSSEVDDAYVIRVHLPSAYNPNLRYPVLYQLDGHTTTGSVIKSYDRFEVPEQFREIIIVTIDYKGNNERVRDFTPTSHSEFERSGGAEDFMNFLKNELVPHINGLYLTDEAFGNTLRGHSLGGLFASYVMFEDDAHTFKNFIIESPSWWWDDNYSIGQEFQYSQANSDLQANVYFAVGEYEGATMKGSFQIITERLKSRNYDGFASTTEILPSQDHLDVRENPNGLRTIFGR